MIWIETVCDICNTTCTGMVYKQGHNIALLKAETKDCGWKTIKGILYCPECQERLKGELDGSN